MEYIKFPADLELFESRGAAEDLLSHWLSRASQRIVVMHIDLVTDAEKLPERAARARDILESRRPMGRGGRLRRLPEPDLSCVNDVEAIARFAYWSIDVVLSYGDQSRSYFFEAKDTASWAEYNLPSSEVANFLADVPANVRVPDLWRHIF